MGAKFSLLHARALTDQRRMTTNKNHDDDLIIEGYRSLARNDGTPRIINNYGSIEVSTRPEVWASVIARHNNTGREKFAKF